MSPRGTRKKSAVAVTRSRKRKRPASVPLAPASVSIDPVATGDPLTDHATVVGLGASAGGLEALKAFFRAMPANDDDERETRRHRRHAGRACDQG